MALAATLLSTALLAACANRHFGGARPAVIAVLLFSTMPVVWLAATGGATQVILLPFVLAWLTACDQFYRAGGLAWLAMAGAAAAAMIYVHLAGVVMAPLYLGLGVLALLARADRMRVCGAMLAGFALVALPWALSVAQDPRVLRPDQCLWSV